MKIPVNVKIGNKYEILSSGIVNLFDNNFSIQLGNLEIEFEFLVDKEDSTTRFSAQPAENKKSIKFSVFNMSNGLLEGFYSPVEIGIWNGRRLLVNFSAWTLDVNNNVRTVVYNLLSGDIVNG